ASSLRLSVYELSTRLYWKAIFVPSADQAGSSTPTQSIPGLLLNADLGSTLKLQGTSCAGEVPFALTVYTRSHVLFNPSFAPPAGQDTFRSNAILVARGDQSGSRSIPP